MRVASFNVNGVQGRLPQLLAWLRATQPDVVCLQELKTASANFPEAALAEVGYGAVWHGQKAYNGVAILARGVTPIETGRGLPGDPDDNQSRYIEAVVNGVVVASIYAPNGNPQPGPRFDYKLAWMERLAAHASALVNCGLPVVLAGDFNVVPTDEVGDIYNPRSWKKDALLQPESRAAFFGLLAQGWTDGLRQLYPQAPLYTFWDYLRQAWPRNAGLRIDHLLVNAELLPRLKDGGVDRDMRGGERPSDHAPVWIELEFHGGSPSCER